MMECRRLRLGEVQVTKDRGARGRVARVIGQALWRLEYRQANPQASDADVRRALRSDWPAVGRDYVRIGGEIHRRLAGLGIDFVEQTPAAAAKAAAEASAANSDMAEEVQERRPRLRFVGA